MEKRKTSGADLENKKGIFLQIGAIIALLAVFMSFQWKQYDRGINMFDSPDVTIIEETPIPITREIIPPPPPKPSHEIKIVDNTVEVKEEFIVDIGANATTEVVDFRPIIIEEKLIKEEKIFIGVEDMPVFPGGDRELFRYLNNSLKYPKAASNAGISGTVIVSFIVEPDGSISNLTILKSGTSMLDEEALRVVSSMPRWKPGLQNGKPVRVRMSLPVIFRLQ